MTLRVISETTESDTTVASTSYESNHNEIASSLGISFGGSWYKAAGASSSVAQSRDVAVSSGSVVFQSSKMHSMVELQVNGDQTCDTDFASDARTDLPFAYNFAKYEAFIEIYGTHVVTEVRSLPGTQKRARRLGRVSVRWHEKNCIAHRC